MTAPVLPSRSGRVGRSRSAARGGNPGRRQFGKYTVEVVDMDLTSEAATRRGGNARVNPVGDGIQFLVRIGTLAVGYARTPDEAAELMT